MRNKTLIWLSWAPLFLALLIEITYFIVGKSGDFQVLIVKPSSLFHYGVPVLLGAAVAAKCILRRGIYPWQAANVPKARRVLALCVSRQE